MKLRGVVPPRRRLAGVGLAARHLRSRRAPSAARSSSLGIAGPKPISIRVPTGKSTGFTLTTVVDAVALGAQLDPPVARRDDEGAVRCEDRAGDHAQAVAERAARRQPQQLGRDHRPGDAEQARDLFRRAVDAAAVVLDEVAAVRQSPDADAGSGVERVVGQFLQHQRRSLFAGTPAFCCSPSTVRKLVQSARSNFKSGTGG